MEFLLTPLIANMLSFGGGTAISSFAPCVAKNVHLISFQFKTRNNLLIQQGHKQTFICN